MKKRLVSLILAASLFAAVPLFASDGAQALFDRAIKLKAAETQEKNQSADASSPTTSAALFAESARLFEVAAATDWHKWYEAGNARWWAGEPDRAILDYRQYLSRDPFRGEVWENLSSARLAAKTSSPGHEGVLDWPWYIWFASAAAFLAGLSAFSFALFLFFRKKAWRNVSVVLLAATVCFGAISAVTLATRGQVSVVVAETQGRKGDSSVYAPYPADPWKAGQEVWVSETRDTWARVIVGSTVSWVPSDSLVLMKK